MKMKLDKNLHKVNAAIADSLEEYKEYFTLHERSELLKVMGEAMWKKINEWEKNV